MVLLTDNLPEGLLEMKHNNDKCCISMNDNLNKVLGISNKTKQTHILFFS